MTTSEQAALLAKHYNVLVAGELGHEFPMFSVGCVCGDMECDDYTTRMEPTDEEQEAIRRLAVSEAVERIVEALEYCEQVLADAQVNHEEDNYDAGQALVAFDIQGILRSRDWSKGEG